jgi:hypothetical protein
VLPWQFDPANVNIRKKISSEHSNNRDAADAIEGKMKEVRTRYLIPVAV